MKLPEASDARVGGFDHRFLMKYLSGDATSEECAQVEAAAAEDPELARFLQDERSDPCPIPFDTIAEEADRRRPKAKILSFPRAVVSRVVLAAAAVGLGFLVLPTRSPDDGRTMIRARGAVSVGVYVVVGPQTRRVSDFSEVKASHHFYLKLSGATGGDVSILRSGADGAPPEVVWVGRLQGGTTKTPVFERLASHRYWVAAHADPLAHRQTWQALK